MNSKSVKSRGRRQQRDEKPYESPKISTPPSSSKSTDIPGFYYDPERRKHFRILSDHHGAGSKEFITPLVIKQREREEDRQNLLKRTKFTDEILNDSAMSMITQRQLGLIGSDRLRRHLKENGLQYGVWGNGTNDPITAPVSAYSHHRHVEIAENGESFIGWGTLKDGSKDFVYHLEVDRKDFDFAVNHNSEYRFYASSMDVLKASERIVDFVATSPSSYLLCIVSNLTPQYTTSVLCHRSIQTRHSPIAGHKNLRENFSVVATTCAWNKVSDRISIGFDGKVIFFNDASSNRMSTRTVRMPHHTPLVQKFSTDGNLLFLGYRNKKVICCDLRSGETEMVIGQSNVSSLYLMTRRDWYAVAGDYSGQIKMWDIRMQKEVRSFEGQINTHYKLPLVVNEDDSLVIAGGEYGTASCWSLETGKLLRQIACPYPIKYRHSESVYFQLPGIGYSNCLGGVHGKAAIILGGPGKFYFYPLKY